MRCYVWATDSFLSGWGCAKGRKAKYVVECDNANQADAIYKAFTERNEMKAINSGNALPHWPDARYQVSVRHVSELGGAWLEHMPREELAKLKGE